MDPSLRTRHRVALARALVRGACIASIAEAVLCLGACSDGNGAAPSAGPADASMSTTDAATPGDAGDAGGETYTESPLTIALALTIQPTSDGGAADAGKPADASAPVDAGASDAEVDDGGLSDAAVESDAAPGVDAAATPDAAAPDAGPSQVAVLTITARDGLVPVVTDLWLYTLAADGTKTPLTGFTSNAARATPRLMLPATIAGKPSGLTPADDGNLNGLMTNTARGKLSQGAFVSTVNGTVVVTLPAIPTSPILVVAGVEDQRYAGAAVIQPDGTPGTVPAGVGTLETHTRVSFERDVKPILTMQCSPCHYADGPDNAGFYLVTGTRDEIVNDNYALKEQTQDCQEAHPDGGQGLASCIQGITSAQFLVEPGAPAISDILKRSRPDEDAGTSPLGLLWYGSRGNRYNATYGDRRMPSTTQSTDAGDWKNDPIYFDLHPEAFQLVYDWVAQGALP